METLDWPESVSKPEFMTRVYGKTTGERSSRVRDAHSFEFWTFSSQTTVCFFSNLETASLGGQITSILVFGKLGSAYMLAVVTQRP